VGDDTGIDAAHLRATDVPNSRGRVWIWTSLLLTLSAVVAAILLAPAGNVAPVRSLTLLLFLGSSVHVATTGYFLTEADIRSHMAQHRTRYVCIPVLLIVLGAALASIVPVRELKWILLVYFAWQFFHFHKQNLGMVALASTSSRLRGPSSAERWAVSVASLFGITGLLARPGLLQLGNRSPFSGLYFLALLGFICAVLSGMALLSVRVRRERSAGFKATYLMALFFFGPVFLFHSPYAAVGGMTIGHGLQYLFLVGLVAAGRGRGSCRAVGLALLLNLGLLGGLLLSVASHLHNAPAIGRAVFGAYLGVAMTHFVIDGGIWRLSEPFPRTFMTSRVPFLVPPVARSLSGDRS
jgi:hypothetical protein